jgi:hypothetical protein
MSLLKQKSDIPAFRRYKVSLKCGSSDGEIRRKCPLRNKQELTKPVIVWNRRFLSVQLITAIKFLLKSVHFCGGNRYGG